MQRPLLMFIRRAAAAMGLAALVAAAVRLRGFGGVPPTSGGWHEVPPAELDH